MSIHRIQLLSVVFLSLCFLQVKSQVFDISELDDLLFDSAVIIKEKVKTVTIARLSNKRKIEGVFYSVAFTKSIQIQKVIDLFYKDPKKKLSSDTIPFNSYYGYVCKTSNIKYYYHYSCNDQNRIIYTDDDGCRTIYTYDSATNNIAMKLKKCQGSRESPSKTTYLYNKLGKLVKLSEWKGRNYSADTDTTGLMASEVHLEDYYAIKYNAFGHPISIKKCSRDNTPIEEFSFNYLPNQLISVIKHKEKPGSDYLINFKYKYSK